MPNSTITRNEQAPLRARMRQMSEIIVLARTRVMATDALLRNYRDQLQELAPNKAGLAGISTWRSLGADGGLMQLLRYTDQAAADDALEALMDSKLGPLVASVTMDPPDVVLISPKKKHGKSFEDVPDGSYCSLAIRFSDPGQQADLELDTEEVLSELAYIPGFLGSAWGNNVALKEEIVSLALWADKDSLESSIPTSHKVRLQRWQKAF